MNRKDNLIKYCFLMSFALLALLVANISIAMVIQVLNINSSKNLSVVQLAEEVVFTEVEQQRTDLTSKEEIVIGMNEEGLARLAENDAFAMILDLQGKVVWNYKMPSELKTQYTIQDVAIMSRWFYEDYPMQNYNLGDYILFVGLPKNSLVKYKMSFERQEFEMLIQAVPYVLFMDLLFLIFVPFFFLKKNQKRQEIQRTSWIAGVSHDIRTPLAIVLGAADQLKHDDRKENVIQKAELIEEQSLRIRTLITNLNMESKLSFGVGNWQNEKVLLPALIREVFCKVLNRSHLEDYDFACEIPEELEDIYVNGDSNLIQRMLENLINNAIVHNPEGCEIIVGMDTAKHFRQVHSLSGRTRIKTHFKKYVFWVEDHGVGVDEKIMRNLNIIKKQDKKIGEHGLGLRIVKLVAKKQNWLCFFQQATPKGFVCTIWFTNTL